MSSQNFTKQKHFQEVFDQWSQTRREPLPYNMWVYLHSVTFCLDDEICLSFLDLVMIVRDSKMLKRLSWWSQTEGIHTLHVSCVVYELYEKKMYVLWENALCIL
jgi:hypothetical protein